MRNIIFCIFLLISLLNYGQRNSTLKNQKLAFKEAERFLKTNQLDMAVEFFRYTNNLDNKSKLGKLAIQKYDSITQNMVLKDIVGKWVLFESGSNWGFTTEKDSITRKVLIITENEFEFYEEDIKTKEKKAIKTEKMIFTKKKDMAGSRLDFVFTDKSLWKFFFDNEGNFLRQFYTGEETDEGRTEMVCGNSDLRYKKYN